MLRNRIKSGTAVHLHGSFWIDREQWESMPWWKQDRLRTLAVGKQATSAVLVGRSAALLWGLDVLGKGADVELVRPGCRPQGKKQWPPGVKYRTSKLLAGDVIRGKEVNYTSLARTIIDVCRWEGFIPGLVAWESALRNGRKLGGMTKSIAAMKGMHGIKNAELVRKWATRYSESTGESFAKGLLIEAGFDFKKFVQNITLILQGEEFRADFLYENWLIIEFDGKIKYSGGKFGDPKRAINDERHRENILRNEGYDTLRVKWSHLIDKSFLEHFKAKLAMRDRQLARKLDSLHDD